MVNLAIRPVVLSRPGDSSPAQAGFCRKVLKKSLPCRLSRHSRSNPVQSCTLHAPASVLSLQAIPCPFRVVSLAGACGCTELTPWSFPSGPLPRR